MSNEAIAPMMPRALGLSEPAVAAAEGYRGCLAVREINNLAALEPYADKWNALLPATPGASYFHSYDWFASYWKWHGGRQKMRVIAVFEEGQLRGIVPFVVVYDWTKVGPLRSLRYPLDGWGSFYGPIGARPEYLLQRAIAHVVATKRDWDLLDMLWVDRDGADGCATERALASVALPARASRWLPSIQIDLSHGWNTYWESRKSHLRTNVRRSERRLRESGTLEHIRHRPLGERQNDGDPRWDLYEKCERIAAESWQGSSTTGTTLSHDLVRDYLRAAHAAAAAFGGVDLNLLSIDGKALAFAYNYHFAGHVYGLRAGFDANFCSAGAGTVLLRMMIEDSCRRGDRLIDLGPGSPESKRQWQTHIATAWRYTHYARPSPRAQLLRALHWIKDSRRRRSRGEA